MSQIMLKASIITATRYRPDLLRRCILAIQKQELQEYEHIIVGDNCDYSYKVYQEFKSDPHIRYYNLKYEHEQDGQIKTHQYNEGSIAQNFGLSVSRGQYICYCNDDNILLPNHCRVLSNTLDQNPNIHFACSETGVVQHEQQGVKAHISSICHTELFDISKIEYQHPHDMICWMHKRHLLHWVCSSYTDAAEDTAITNNAIQTGMFGKILYQKDLTSLYHVHGGHRKYPTSNHEDHVDPYYAQLEALGPNDTYVFPEIVYE